MAFFCAVVPDPFFIVVVRKRFPGTIFLLLGHLLPDFRQGLFPLPPSFSLCKTYFMTRFSVGLIRDYCFTLSTGEHSNFSLVSAFFFFFFSPWVRNMFPLKSSPSPFSKSSQTPNFPLFSPPPTRETAWPSRAVRRYFPTQCMLGELSFRDGLFPETFRPPA